MLKYWKWMLVLFVAILSSCKTTQQPVKQSLVLGENPKREFRGAWIQTAFQGEYKEMSVKEMRRSFIRKLDFLEKCGINAIIFQVRPEADAFYRSKLEPWSRFYTGEQGRAPEGNFDVMAFLIEECHKRNMEFHAWLNPYRISTAGNTKFADSHIYHQHPEWFVKDPDGKPVIYGKERMGNWSLLVSTCINGGYQEKKVLDQGRPRKLTEIEYERLQGLPDGYTDVPINGKKMSYGKRCSLMGNGWNEPTIEWILQGIKNDNSQKLF